MLNAGVAAALGAALLFGAGTPLAKLLLGSVGPWMLAGLFYLGSGLGLTLYRLATRAAPVKLARGEAVWLAGATLSGGVVGPLLLMAGLSGMPASGASLLLNAEGVFTAVLAWVAFRENFDRRIALGMVLIAAGAVVLSWPESVSWAGLWPALAILGACFAWGLDNNLTRKVALNDATWIASVKGLVAGSVNLVLALLGGEPVTLTLLVAGVLMAAGVWLHLTEQHAHVHAHEAMLHDHEHEHDEHHQHTHADGQFTAGKHAHPHRHEPLSHAHAHYPDAHHRHRH